VLQYVRIKRIKNMLIKRIKRVVLHGLCWLCCNMRIKTQYADNMRVGLRNMRQNMRVGLCCNMPIKRQYAGCVVEHIVCCRVVCCRVKITCEPMTYEPDPLSVLAFTYEQLKSSLSFFPSPSI
jgi:hypothetical protein